MSGLNLLNTLSVTGEMLGVLFAGLSDTKHNFLSLFDRKLLTIVHTLLPRYVQHINLPMQMHWQKNGVSMYEVLTPKECGDFTTFLFMQLGTF